MVVLGVVLAVAAVGGADAADAPAQGAGESTPRTLGPFNGTTRDLMAALDRLEQEAEHAPKERAWQAWYDLGYHGLLALAGPPWTGDRQYAEEVRKKGARALAKAADHLDPSGLAALGAIVPHPMLGTEFARRMIGARDPDEAANESRDLLAAWGPDLAREASDLWKKAKRPASAAGGVSHSVFRIGVVTTHGDYKDESESFMNGLRSGLASGGGPVGKAFLTSLEEAQDEAGSSARAAARLYDVGAGVLISGFSEPSAASVAALGEAHQLAVLDPRGQVMGSDPSLDKTAWRDSAGVRFSSGGLVSIRPSGADRGRMLAEHASRVLHLRAVAVAFPEEGADLPFTHGFMEAARASGIEVHILPYAEGRRSYKPEVARFRATRAEALVLAGPAEESAEWLLALSAAKLKPTILGSDELDPAGLHERARAAAEGAVYVSSKWVPSRLFTAPVDTSSGPAASFDSSSRAGGSFGSERDDAYVRGYLMGRVVGQIVRAGAITPSRLRRALAARTVPGTSAMAILPDEASLPLYRVRNGKAEVLELKPFSIPDR